MPEGRRERGLIDTAVILDLADIDPSKGPLEMTLSAISLAELAAGGARITSRPPGCRAAASGVRT